MRNYIPPILVLIAFTALLVYWANHEYAWIQSQSVIEMKSSSETTALVLEATLRTELRRGNKILRSRLEQVFTDLLKQTPLIRIELRTEAEKLLAVGDEHTFANGYDPVSNIFCATRRLQLSGPEGYHTGQSHRRGRRNSEHQQSGEWLTLDTAKASLLTIYDVKTIATRASRAGQRVMIAFLVGSIAVLGLMAVWLLSIHNRRLHERLLLSQAEREHLEELGQIAAGLAHDTKNPLGLIRGTAEQLSKTVELDEAEKTAVLTIIEQADVASARLGAFITYAKPVKPVLAWIKLDTVCEKVRGLMQDELASAAIQFDIKPSLHSVMCDQSFLLQILMNLVLNSVQACNENGGISLSLETKGEVGQLHFNDTGKGIDSGLLPHIFDPYVSKTPDGTGLGLAMVKRLVSAHGWSINVLSKPDKGTTFTISGIKVRTDRESA